MRRAREAAFEEIYRHCLRMKLERLRADPTSWLATLEREEEHTPPA